MSAAVDGRTILIVDTDAGWERIAVAGRRIVRVHPKDVHRLDAGEAVATIVNLAAPGVVEQLAGWSRGPGTPPSACVTVPGNEHVVWLRGVAVVRALRPADPVAVYVRRRRRTARVVAAGGNAGALLALRRVLGADGIGVSLAWDALQAQDLCDLVHPHVVVIDLALPRGGHDLVVGLGLRRNVPDLVVLPAGDDARAFAAAFERARRRERLALRREAIAQLAPGPAPGRLHAGRAHG
jgi:hypothetical protein